jgi:tRNA (guanine37-N1)-methyltransferase
MVLMIEPIARCIDGLKQQRTYNEVIYVTPDGDYSNKKPQIYFTQTDLIIFAGHYKGVDERVREHW